MNEQYNPDAPAYLPLTDGTFAVVTNSARYTLDEDFGVTKARLKKGAGGNGNIVVKITKGDYASKKDINLRDLLAVWVYFGTWREKNENRGQSFKLVDGDPRNLMRDNIALTPEPTRKAMKTKKLKTVAESKTRKADALPIAVQEALLEEVFPKMRGVAGAILKPESVWQADDVCQKVALALLIQIRSGNCDATNSLQFSSWAITAVKRHALWKMNAIQNGVCRDVDHDRAEIRLLRVKRLNARLLENAGLSVEVNENMLPSINMGNLARELEEDAAENARQERERIAAERGGWNNVDLEAGTEVFESESSTDPDDDQRGDFDVEDFRQRWPEAA